MDKVKRIICDALGLKGKEIKDTDGPKTIKEWDSLGQLSILTSLDKEFSGKAANIENLAQAQSVREIVKILRKNGLVEK